MNFREIPQPVGAPEASHAALSAHQIFRPGDIAAAHAAIAPAPGAESALAALPGANEPISPLIQLIMRMPGQVGLMSSFFEAIGNFILPHVQGLAGGFDPSIFTAHADAAASLGDGSSMIGLDHAAVDLSLLPQDAPVFSTDSIATGSTLDGSNLASNQPFNLHERDALGELLGDPRTVSGGVDPGKAVYEQAAGTDSEVLSGPSLTEGNPASHLSGTQRLFADHPSRGFGSMLAHSSGNAASSAVTPAQTVPVAQTASSVPSSFNVNGSPFQQVDANSAAGSFKDVVAPSGTENAGYALGNSNVDTQALGPSGSVGDRLSGASGGDQQYLAMDRTSQTFKPTLGNMPGNDYDANYLQQQPADASHHASHGSDAPLKGLKAEQLTLDGKHVPQAESAVAHAKAAAHQAASNTPSHSTAQSSSHSTVEHATHKAHDQIAHRVFHKVQYHHSAPALEQNAATPADTQNLQGAQEATTAVDQNGQPIADASQAGDAQIANPQPTTYTIRAGDCLWNIAKDQLGSATRWEEIYKINADVLGANPDMIFPGTQIQLPGVSPEVASHQLNAAGHYIVKPGDNLWNLSKEFLGGGEKWGEIYRANADVIGSNPSLIFPGQELTIPGAGDAASATVADAGSTAASTAGQQVATAASTSVPQAIAPAQDIANYGAQGTMDSGIPQQVDVPQTTPDAVSQQTMQAPAAVQPSVTAVPAANPPAPGPGAASAATLNTTPMSDAAPAAQSQPLVSSSLAGDLSNFLAKKK